MPKLPTLFAKLVGQYGDDVLRYGDEVAEIAANYGDDVALKQFSNANFTDDLLKYSQIEPRTSKPLSFYKNEGYRWANDDDILGKLGSIDPDDGIIPQIDAPGIDPNSLVGEYLNVKEIKPYGSLESSSPVIRPHNNTALGRWFRQQMSKKVL